jgi:hypothetical protein
MNRKARLLASIRESRFTILILVGAEDDTIAAHTRLLASRKLGDDASSCHRAQALFARTAPCACHH